MERLIIKKRHRATLLLDALIVSNLYYRGKKGKITGRFDRGCNAIQAGDFRSFLVSDGEVVFSFTQ
jgi:hypothetical protein